MVGNWQIFIQSGKLNCCHHRAAGRGDTRTSRVLSKLLNEIRSYISYTFDVICELQHSTCFILIWSYSCRPFQITFVARQNSFFFSFKFHFHGRATSQYFFQFQQFSGRIVDVFDILYHFPAKLLTPSSTDRALSVMIAMGPQSYQITGIFLVLVSKTMSFFLV